MPVLLCNWERKPIVLIHGRIIHPGAMNHETYYSHSRASIDTPQPDGSVVKTGNIQTLGLYIIPSGIMVLKETASCSLIIIYLSNQIPIIMIIEYFYECYGVIHLQYRTELHK
jgi:hypothetical protein